MTMWSLPREPIRDCDIEIPYCDYRVNCEECPFYMDECDGDPEKLEKDIDDC